jgi:hypothetical protein
VYLILAAVLTPCVGVVLVIITIFDIDGAGFALAGSAIPDGDNATHGDYIWRCEYVSHLHSSGTAVLSDRARLATKRLSIPLIFPPDAHRRIVFGLE